MVRDVIGTGGKRVVILLAMMAVAMFTAVSLMPGEPAAQTASPNGKIVYAGFDSATNRTHIYTVNPDGTGVTNLTEAQTDPNWSPRIPFSDGPEWSPDGTKISASGSSLSDIGSCCSRNVYVMDADGTNVQRLTNTPSTTEGEDYQATWAPDGRWLAFVSTRSDGPRDPENPDDSSDREIYRMNADGTNEQQLTDTPSVSSDEQPSISPDGTKIAFASSQHYQQFGDPDGDQLDIYVMDANGGAAERLTFDSGTKNPTINLLSESRNPAWSPDGMRIAYESTRSGNSEIWVMNADGTGEPVNVSQHESWDSNAAWSPDGTQITFQSRRAGQDDIWVVDAPPPPNAAASFSALSVGTDTAVAAVAPRNLTANTSIKAGSPDWGTAPTGSTNTCTIEGTPAAETIPGTSGADVICAGGGNDTVKGLGGNDTLKGQAGNDTLLGGVGNDSLDGGAGTDTASYSASLTAVNASLETNSSTGEGSDTFLGVENLLGSSKADNLTGSGTNNKLTGGGGNDTQVGGSGNDTMLGSGGADAIDSKDGMNGNDSLNGGAGTDTKVTDDTEKSIRGFP